MSAYPDGLDAHVHPGYMSPVVFHCDVISYNDPVIDAVSGMRKILTQFCGDPGNQERVRAIKALVQVELGMEVRP